MTLRRDINSSDRVGSESIARLHEDRRRAPSRRLGTGTLACPVCDAPVALAGPASATEPLDCPFCRHTAPVRSFLSLGTPARPARVEVRVVQRARRVAG